MDLKELFDRYHPKQLDPIISREKTILETIIQVLFWMEFEIDTQLNQKGNLHALCKVVSRSRLDALKKLEYLLGCTYYPRIRREKSTQNPRKTRATEC